MLSIQALMDGILDYAGLFPPAKLDMVPTMRNYHAYREGPDSWMLGRIVVPVARFAEFEANAEGLLSESRDPVTDDCWVISALTVPVSDDGFPRELELIEAFNERHLERGSHAVAVDTIEVKAASAAEVDRALELIPEFIFPYFELDHRTDVRGAVAAIAGMDAGAKIRSGGITPDLHPTPTQFAEFIAACCDAEIPFKATAGLHHPLRHHADSVGCDQYGFLNVFVGACLAWWDDEVTPELLERILEARTLDEFTFEPERLGFAGHLLSCEHVEQARERFCHAYGSCSFEEPLEDLVGLGLLTEHTTAT
ncbi:MAG: hypothetical protein VX641_06905 [Planctomycetota bacterium]|nr:hypothetical protein [Planctomycetota bacterium]